MLNEEWKDIPDLLGYQVSSLGRVRSKDRILKPRLPKDKYPTVSIRYYPHRIHRLVAKAFLPNPENKPSVNHIDGNKSNNHYYNLEWCTQKQNSIHAYNYGLSRKTFERGDSHLGSKLTNVQVLQIKRILRHKIPLQLIADKYAVSRNCIKDIRSKKNWGHLTVEGEL
jgi:hypothetical protein